MILYIIYGVILSFEMAAEIFPLDSDPIMKRVPLLQTCKDCGNMYKKGFSAFILFGMLSVLFFTLVIFVQSWKFTGNTIKNIEIRSTFLSKTKKGFMDVNALEASGNTIAIIASFFVLVCMIRAFMRRAGRSVRSAKTSNPAQIISEYKKAIASGNPPSAACDWTLWLAILGWGLCILWSFIFYLYIK
jgi:hypothetical protein